MKYLGSFTYFATGEGYRDYYLLISANSEEEALDKFVEKTTTRCYGKKEDLKESHPTLYAKGLEFSRYGCRVREISSVKLDDFNEPMRSIIEAVKGLCEKQGMIDGDFEYWFQYNLS